MTIRWKAVEQYFTVVVFVFQFSLVCNCWIFINFVLSTHSVRSGRVNKDTTFHFYSSWVLSVYNSFDHLP